MFQAIMRIREFNAVNRTRSITFAACLFLGLACGCGKPSADTSTGPRMGMMPKLVGIPYFNACRVGAEQAAKELGIELVFDGPATDSVEQQVQMVEDWTALGYDIIAVTPNDPEVISPSLRRAREAGIVTLTWDADANPTASQRQAFVNQAPAEEIGNAMVDVLGEQLQGQGKAVIVTGSANSPNQAEWMRVMHARLADRYPGIQLLETLKPEEDQNRARQLTLNVLAAHEDLAGIFGITSVSLPGAAQAVRQAGKTGKVKVTGLGLPSEVRPYVEDGTVEKFVLWNPIDLGYLTVYIAKALRDGKLQDGVHQFGRLSNVRVHDGEVILGPPVVFDRDNIDQFDF